MKKRILIFSLLTALIVSFFISLKIKQRSGADVAQAETGTLSGSVTEAETGLPIFGAVLWLSNPSVLGREVVIINTDENGKCQVPLF